MQNNEAYLIKRSNPLILKQVIKLIEEERALTGVKASDLLGNIGFDSLEVAHLSIRLEEQAGIYVSDVHAWAAKDDNAYTLAIKLERLIEKHKARYL